MISAFDKWLIYEGNPYEEDFEDHEEPDDEEEISVTYLSNCCGAEIKPYDVHKGLSRCPDCKDNCCVVSVDENGKEKELWN